MRKKIIITYWWDTDEYPDLTSEQKDALENAAEDRITEMRQEYCSGELVYEDDEIYVTGWWESSKTDDE